MPYACSRRSRGRVRNLWCAAPAVSLVPQSCLSTVWSRAYGIVVRAATGASLACCVLPRRIHSAIGVAICRQSYQKKLLSVLFRAAFDSLSALCTDTKYLGGRIGALAVAHTWTRSLEWHPHIHMLVPAGALTRNEKWVTLSKRKVRFLVPEGALARKFWGRFMHLARRALPQYRFPDLPRRKRWIVYCKETVQGSERVLEYLGRYVNRTALSNHAILACTDQAVTFRYQDSRDSKTRVMTLHPHEFLRRFLQHLPPRGFHRVREFGLLHARQRHALLRLQLSS